MSSQLPVKHPLPNQVNPLEIAILNGHLLRRLVEKQRVEAYSRNRNWFFPIEGPAITIQMQNTRIPQVNAHPRLS